MAFRVKSGSFEGPFDLLLELVTRQKIDIGSISIAEIADQYLAEVSSLSLVDLDVASDFLLVAATLLEIKAAALLKEPTQAAEIDREQAASASLIERLIAYRQFKSAAAALMTRESLQNLRHGRDVGVDESFTEAMPDFLAVVTLEELSARAATLLGRRELALLESEHIAPTPPPVERYVAALERLLTARGKLTFREVLDGDSTPAIVVVNFLAMLELYKRQEITIVQESPLGDITIERIEAPAGAREGGKR